jgi:methylenetetrahydrofolate dehydrogenase (NADP+)/methenyltetrahydrofolate cyclohydrolase
LVGDVDFEAIKDKAEWITPVPGGIGLMTIVSLIKIQFRLTIIGR